MCTVSAPHILNPTGPGNKRAQEGQCSSLCIKKSSSLTDLQGILHYSLRGDGRIKVDGQMFMVAPYLAAYTLFHDLNNFKVFWQQCSKAANQTCPGSLSRNT